MAGTPRFDDVVATELHNRLAKQIVSLIADEPIKAGGTISDVMALLESVLVDVVLGCFAPGSDVKALDLVVGRVKERLAQVRLNQLETKGSS